MGDIDVVRLGARGENGGRLMIAMRGSLFAKNIGRKLADDVGFAARYRVQIVADPDDLYDFVHLIGKIGNDGRWEFHGPFFAVDMRSVAFAHEPIVAAIDPGVELVRRDDRENGFDGVSGQDALFDQRKVRPDKLPAVEGSERSR